MAIVIWQRSSNVLILILVEVALGAFELSVSIDENGRVLILILVEVALGVIVFKGRTYGYKGS